MISFNKWQALHLGMKLALAVIGACFLAHVDFDFTFSFFFLWKGLSNMKKKGRWTPSFFSLLIIICWIKYHLNTLQMSFKCFFNSHFVFGVKNHISFLQDSSFRFAVIKFWYHSYISKYLEWGLAVCREYSSGWGFAKH